MSQMTWTGDLTASGKYGNDVMMIKETAVSSPIVPRPLSRRLNLLRRPNRHQTPVQTADDDAIAAAIGIAIHCQMMASRPMAAITSIST